MTYRRFKFSEGAPATVATLATLRDELPPTVATFATVAGVAARKTNLEAALDPDAAEIEYRKGIAMGGVPEAYLDAWARLQVQRPMAVTEAERRQAIRDAGLFLDAWGAHAVEFQWQPGGLIRRFARWQPEGPRVVSQGRSGARYWRWACRDGKRKGL